MKLTYIDGVACVACGVLLSWSETHMCLQCTKISRTFPQTTCPDRSNHLSSCIQQTHSQLTCCEGWVFACLFKGMLCMTTLSFVTGTGCSSLAQSSRAIVNTKHADSSTPPKTCVRTRHLPSMISLLTFPQSLPRLLKKTPVLLTTQLHGWVEVSLMRLSVIPL